MRADLTLDKHKAFNVSVFTFHKEEDGTVVANNIEKWIIKGAVIIKLADEIMDVPLIATTRTDIDGVPDPTLGLFDLSMAVADQDDIFKMFTNKHALAYEVRVNFFNNTGMILSEGNLILRRSRLVSV